MRSLLGLALLGAATVNAAVNTNPLSSVVCAKYKTAPRAITTQPKLVKPQDIAIDGGGDIFVVDSVDQKLIRVDALTQKSLTMLNNNTLVKPVGLAISPLHADLYVGDEGTGNIYHILCQQRNQKYCTTYHPEPVTLDLQGFTIHPMGLQMDAEDHLYIADFNNHRVIKRNANSGNLTVLMDYRDLGVNNFGPHDIAIDTTDASILVTDLVNDEIYTLKCSKKSKDGTSCDVYNPVPKKLALNGTQAHIEAPSGIATDLQSTIYVTGMKDGVVAEIKGGNALDLLAENKGIGLRSPVSLAHDPVSKTLYISDDQATNQTSTGLYGLDCLSAICTQVSDYLENVGTGLCANTPVGTQCNLVCANGYHSPNKVVNCTSTGWSLKDVACVAIPNPGGSGSGGGGGGHGSATTPATDAGAVDGAGIAVGITLTVLVVLGVCAFLFIRYRQGKLVVKTTDYAAFGSE